MHLYSVTCGNGFMHITHAHVWALCIWYNQCMHKYKHIYIYLYLSLHTTSRKAHSPLFFVFFFIKRSPRSLKKPESDPFRWNPFNYTAGDLCLLSTGMLKKVKIVVVWNYWVRLIIAMLKKCIRQLGKKCIRVFLISKHSINSVEKIIKLQNI